MKAEDFLLGLLNDFEPNERQKSQIQREWDEEVKPLMSVLVDNEVQRKLLLSDDGNFLTVAWPAWGVIMEKFSMMIPLFGQAWGRLMVSFVRATFMLGYQTRMAEELTFVVAEEGGGEER